MSLLEVKDLCSSYGSAQVVFDVSLEVKSGEIVCLLGRNGAGKTTTILSILGLVKIKKGVILFNGEDITNIPVYERVRRGIGYVPDNRGIFSDLTTFENLKIATIASKTTIDIAYEYFPELKEHLYKKGKNLSGGERTMCAIARALILNPKLLIMDEPFTGLSPGMVDRLVTILKRITKETGKAILLSEENIPLALELADRIYIMQEGRITFNGSPSEAAKVIEKYISIF
ncbi:MAG: ABC transporter ATP-binding protein [Sulfolobales archaeon]